MASNYNKNQATSLMGHQQVYDDSKLRQRTSLLISGLLLCFIIAIAALIISVMLLLKEEETPSLTQEEGLLVGHKIENAMENSKKLLLQLEDLLQKIEALSDRKSVGEAGAESETRSDFHSDPGIDVDDDEFEYSGYDVSMEYDDVDLYDPISDDSMHSHHHGHSSSSKDMSSHDPDHFSSSKDMSLHDHDNGNSKEMPSHHLELTNSSKVMPPHDLHDHDSHTGHVHQPGNVAPTQPPKEILREQQTAKVPTELEIDIISDHLCHGQPCLDIEGSGFNIEDSLILSMLPLDDDILSLEGSSNFIADDCEEFSRPTCPEDASICLTKDPCPIPICCFN